MQRIANLPCLLVQDDFHKKREFLEFLQTLESLTMMVLTFILSQCFIVKYHTKFGICFFSNIKYTAHGPLY